jgi:hypothetical protein
LKISATALCSVVLIAATKRTEVSQAQIGQFHIGGAIITAVEGKLGMPQNPAADMAELAKTGSDLEAN